MIGLDSHCILYEVKIKKWESYNQSTGGLVPSDRKVGSNPVYQYSKTVVENIVSNLKSSKTCF